MKLSFCANNLVRILEVSQSPICSRMIATSVTSYKVGHKGRLSRCSTVRHTAPRTVHSCFSGRRRHGQSRSAGGCMIGEAVVGMLAQLHET